MKLLIPYWIKILPLVSKYNSLNISIMLNMTYSQTHRVINTLQREGYLERPIKSGRLRINILTDKGLKVAEACEKLLKVIEK